MTLRIWHWEYDTENMTLRIWHSEYDTQNMTLRIWHSEYDTQNMTIRIWHSEYDTQSMTLRIWHSEFDTQNMTISIMAEQCYTECRLCWLSLILSISYEPLMLSVLMLNVILQSVVAPPARAHVHCIRQVAWGFNYPVLTELNVRNFWSQWHKTLICP